MFFVLFGVYKEVIHFQRRETVGKTLEFYSEITNQKYISRVLLCNIVIINLTMMNGRKTDNLNFL